MRRCRPHQAGKQQRTDSCHWPSAERCPPGCDWPRSGSASAARIGHRHRRHTASAPARANNSQRRSRPLRASRSPPASAKTKPQSTSTRESRAEAQQVQGGGVQTHQQRHRRAEGLQLARLNWVCSTLPHHAVPARQPGESTARCGVCSACKAGYPEATVPRVWTSRRDRHRARCFTWFYQAARFKPR